MGQLASYVQILIIALAVMGPAISFVIKKLSEQRAKKQALELERRRRDEILRTGRDPLAEAAAAEQRRVAQTLAQAQAQAQASAGPMSADGELARRQAKLRELRERRQREQQGQVRAPGPVAPAAPATGSQPGRPITRELWPGGPVVIIGTDRPATPQPAPVQPAARNNTPPGGRVLDDQRRARERTPVPEPLKSAPAQPSKVDVQRMRAREDAEVEAENRRRRQLGDRIAKSDQPATPPSRPRQQAPAGAGVPRTTAQWRQAFIMAELLRPPVALRAPDADGRLV